MSGCSQNIQWMLSSYNNTVDLLPDSANVDTIAPWKLSLSVKRLLFLLFIHSVRVLYKSPVKPSIDR